MRRCNGVLLPSDRIMVDPLARIKPHYLSFEEAAWKWRCPILDFVPTRTVTFTDAAGLTAAINGLQAGDLVKYTGTGVLTISNSTTSALVFNAKAPASMVWFDFGNPWGANYVHFQYTGTTWGWYAMDFENGCANIGTYGGYFSGSATNQTGRGITIEGPATNIQCWDFRVDSCGSDATAVAPISGDITNCFLRGDVSDWGLNVGPNNQPHNEIGTGFHGCQFSDSAHKVTNTTLVYRCHDSDCGAGVQVGNPNSTMTTSGCVFYIKSERLNYAATLQVASNTLQLWGSADVVGTAELLIGENQQGRVVDCQSLSGSVTGLVVKHGRAHKTNLNGSMNSSYDITDPWGKDPANLSNFPAYQEVRKA